MTDSALESRVRQYRARADLSQADLASRVGVSRQAIVAIEAGRQNPSAALALTLARVLACRVEDLFSLPSQDTLRARVSGPPQRCGDRVLLGEVDGCWVAHPVTQENALGDARLDEDTSTGCLARVEPFRRLPLRDAVFVAGCAPLLGLLSGLVEPLTHETRAHWISANSEASLELLRKGLVHVAGVHLPGDGESRTEKVVQATMPEEDCVLVELTRFRQGLVVASGDPKGISGVADALRPGVVLAHRELGSGAENVLQHEIERACGGLRRVPGGPIASSHAEVARLVQLGVADAGVAVESVALLAGLCFVPLSEERFELVVPVRYLTSRPVARLFDILTERTFRKVAESVPGYDLSSLGRRVTSTHAGGVRVTG